MNANHAKFAAVFGKAHAAGLAAGNGHKPTAMIVGEPTTPFGNDIDHSKPTYFVADGACGFAWVVVRPGNCAFANWLKKNGHGRTGYGGGVHIWIRDHGQSYERKLAHASAMAKVFATELGVKAYADSRLD